ncbi:hypothetical protein ElyMa_005745900 [Elysia marginata]|uniref:Uncharacterized protein n=1 Tax=Elysia marginata TaxID=1093978 RepID=A0AAV4FLA7_9GAST|nr:hypothetical protein ElyMa_005745900 [Elysia marginata]
MISNVTMTTDVTMITGVTMISDVTMITGVTMISDDYCILFPHCAASWSSGRRSDFGSRGNLRPSRSGYRDRPLRPADIERATVRATGQADSAASEAL